MTPKIEKKSGEDQSTDEGIKAIHEMITEVLMGTVQSSIDSGYTNANFNSSNLNDHTHQIMYGSYDNVEESNLTLGKLYLQFQNLDFRLSRVEKVIGKRDDFDGNAVKKRVTTLSRSGYPGSTDPCFGSSSNPDVGSSSTGFMSIDPILTSSADLDSFPTSSSAYSLPSISSSTQHSHYQRKDEIKRSELDHLCLPLLERNPKPTTEELQEVVILMTGVYPKVAKKHLLSKVREWFRKRREYMSQRIFLACSCLYRDLHIKTESDLEAEIFKLNQNSAIIGYVLKEANLEIVNIIAAREYCQEKILSYLNSLYKPSSIKNRGHE